MPYNVYVGSTCNWKCLAKRLNVRHDNLHSIDATKRICDIIREHEITEQRKRTSSDAREYFKKYPAADHENKSNTLPASSQKCTLNPRNISS